VHSERRQRRDRIFGDALSASTAERPRLVRERCGSDAELRAEIDSLLRHHVRTDGFLDPPFARAGELPVATAAPVAGDRVGPYRIVRRLGSGGMGIVFLADQEHPLRRQLALKIVRSGLESAEVLARFESERQSLAIMNHPHIARVFDAGVTASGLPYFAMEYVAGTPLTRHCDRLRLQQAARLRLFVQACHAIQHAHQNGVIHRDIKPANLLVTDDGQLKVIDFGIAKATTPKPGDAATLTRAGDVVGTPLYMSPEQALGDAYRVDTRSDVYALGVVLFELVTGRLPFTARSRLRSGWTEVPRPSEWLRTHRRAATVAAFRRGTVPAQFMRQSVREIDWIVARATALEPSERYQSALELAQDIERCLAGDPLVAGPASRAYRWRKFVRRNRAVAAATALAAGTLIVGLIITTVLYWSAERAREDAIAQRDAVLRLSDGLRLEQLRASADSFAAVPADVPRMRAWLDGPARELAARLPRHGETLRALERRATTAAELPVELAFQLDQLTTLVRALATFVDADPRIGTVAAVRERVQFAEQIRERSLVEHAREWDAAIAAIADPTRAPAYAGLRIVPQVGLVPIGPDPVSGLWEFVHLRSGDIPLRDAGGRLRVDAATGIVFVLLPGGRATLGCAPVPKGTAGDGRDHKDHLAEERESPVHTLDLEPFFLSKYEMTQGQWLRATRHNPSESPPGRRWGDKMHDLRHPVDNVSWWDCDRVMRQLGLGLPTEAQWEYAARAGTTTRWWTGSRESTLEGAANLPDRGAIARGKPAHWRGVAWDDGYADTAPVGCYRANAFGLHDVLGNVYEWCRDRFASYSSSAAAGDGERHATGDSPDRIARGGDYGALPNGIRSSRRLKFPPTNSSQMGVRPARRVEFIPDQPFGSVSAHP
jgi:serine/threonine protein kinase/formylglycine-generating enzyme required for sulfatase activity